MLLVIDVSNTNMVLAYFMWRTLWRTGGSLRKADALRMKQGF